MFRRSVKNVFVRVSVDKERLPDPLRLFPRLTHFDEAGLEGPIGNQPFHALDNLRFLAVNVDFNVIGPFSLR